MDELMNTTNFIQSSINNNDNHLNTNEHLTKNSNGTDYSLVEDLNNFMFESQQTHQQQQQQQQKQDQKIGKKSDSQIKQKMNNDANFDSQFNQNGNRDHVLNENEHKTNDPLASSGPAAVSINHSKYANSLSDTILQTPTSTSKSFQFEYKQSQNQQQQQPKNEEDVESKIKKTRNSQKNTKYSKAETISSLLDDLAVLNVDDSQMNSESPFKASNNANNMHNNGNHPAFSPFAQC